MLLPKLVTKPKTSDKDTNLVLKKEKVRKGGSFLGQRVELAQLHTPANTTTGDSSRQLWDTEDSGYSSHDSWLWPKGRVLQFVAGRPSENAPLRFPLQGA